MLTFFPSFLPSCFPYRSVLECKPKADKLESVLAHTQPIGNSAVPIDYYIDHSQRVVCARGIGTFTGADVFAYQREVWARPDVLGYDELVDMTQVEAIVTPRPAGPRMRELAAQAAAQDNPARAAKLAIVAPDRLAYLLARQFQSHRDLEPQSTKQVKVLRTLAEAWTFLAKETLEDVEYRRVTIHLND
jgi:hypothetical protein